MPVSKSLYHQMVMNNQISQSLRSATHCLITSKELKVHQDSPKNIELNVL